GAGCIEAIKQRRHLGGSGDPNRVTQRQLAGPHVQEPGSDTHDLLGVYGAFPWITETHRYIGPHVHSRLHCSGDDGLKQGELFVEAGVQVLLGEGLGGAGEYCDMGAAGFLSPVESTCIGYQDRRDRKSTRLNSSHVSISYAVFCLKKKKKQELDDCMWRVHQEVSRRAYSAE